LPSSRRCGTSGSDADRFDEVFPLALPLSRSGRGRTIEAFVTATILLQVVVGGLLMGLIYALVAAGLSLIFGLMDVVNFAHGELLMLAMYATFVGWSVTGLDPLLLLLPVAFALFALGVAIYHLLMARALSVRFNRGMVQIFVTFGLAILLRGAAQFVFGSDFKSVGTSLLAGRTVDLAGIFIPLPQLAAGIVSLFAFALLLLISRTEFGRALEATREDRDAVIGIDRDRIFALGWGLGAATVGIAGAMLATFYYVSPNVGANFALIAYVTVALGGFGSLSGALVAGLLIGQVEALTAFLIEPSLKQVGMFAIYLAVLMFRPRGLFGTL
jgi:branched-chain amino acid transport system permease protein